MSGLIGGIKYKWTGTNLALFGTDKERYVKKESAIAEEAWKPVVKINQSCLMVWRVKNFKLEPVSKDDLGKFFAGDSYIILNVEKKGDELLYDVHFWIGKDSTADEYGTAAYKTAELDTLLDDKAIQHREVDGFESQTFKEYFPSFETLEGGYDSGFNHVKPEEFKPRLLVFHITDRTHVQLREVTFSRRSLDSGDVFILDLGTKAYQWNGKGSNKDEKFRASQFMQQLEHDRNGRCTTYVLEEGDGKDEQEFLSLLPDVPKEEKAQQEVGKKAVYKLSDASGKMEMTLVCEGKVPKNVVNKNDVFIIDTGSSLFVYIGVDCSRAEKLNALGRAHEYLKSTKHTLAPITVVSGNRKSKELDKVWD